jgi:hypothetical protein
MSFSAISAEISVFSDSKVGTTEVSEYRRVLMSQAETAKLSNTTVQTPSRRMLLTKPYVREEYPLSEVTSRIIKAAKEVHSELGPGFQEVIYQRALALELPMHGLDFSREVWMDVHGRGTKVGRKRVDFIVDEVMVEIKAKVALEVE